MSCQDSSLFTAQKQKGKELICIYFSPFEKRVTLQSAALAILLEVFHYFSSILMCSRLDFLMKNHEKNVIVKVNGDRDAGHVPFSAHSFFPCSHSGPVSGSGLVKPLLPNPENSTPEDSLECYTISGHQNKGHPGLQLNLHKTT